MSVGSRGYGYGVMVMDIDIDIVVVVVVVVEYNERYPRTILRISIHMWLWLCL